jgi:hypothetical protein
MNFIITNELRMIIFELIFIIILFKTIYVIINDFLNRRIQKKWIRNDIITNTVAFTREGILSVPKIVKLRRGDKILVVSQIDEKKYVGKIGYGIFIKYFIIPLSDEYISDIKIISIYKIINKVIDYSIVIFGFIASLLLYSKMKIVIYVYMGITILLGLCILYCILWMIVKKIIYYNLLKDFSFDFSTGSPIIIGYKGIIKDVLYIPNKIKGMEINCIGSLKFLFDLNDNQLRFKYISIPRSIKIILETNKIFCNDYNESTLDIIYIGDDVDIQKNSFGIDFYEAYMYGNKQGGKYCKVNLGYGNIRWEFYNFDLR